MRRILVMLAAAAALATAGVGAALASTADDGSSPGSGDTTTTTTSAPSWYAASACAPATRPPNVVTRFQFEPSNVHFCTPPPSSEVRSSATYSVLPMNA